SWSSGTCRRSVARAPWSSICERTGCTQRPPTSVPPLLLRPSVRSLGRASYRGRSPCSSSIPDTQSACLGHGVVATPARDEQRRDREQGDGRGQRQRDDERDGRDEEYGERLREGLELHHHNRAHAHGREGEHQEERPEGLLLAGILPAQRDAYPRRWRLVGEQPPDVPHHTTQRAAAHVRCQGDHLLLILALQAQT